MKRTEKSNLSLLPGTRKKPFYRRHHIVSMLPGVLLFLVLLTFMLFRYQLVFHPTVEPPRNIQEELMGTHNIKLPELPTAPTHSKKAPKLPKSAPLLSAQSSSLSKPIPAPPPPITEDTQENSIDPAVLEIPALPVKTVTNKPMPVTFTHSAKKKKANYRHPISSQALTKLKKSLNNKHVLEALVLPVKIKKNVDVRNDSSRALEKLRKKKPNLP